jgi:hypothetical protein
MKERQEAVLSAEDSVLSEKQDSGRSTRDPVNPAGRWPAIGALTQRTQRTARKVAKKPNVWTKRKLFACDGRLANARSGTADSSGFFSVPCVSSVAKNAVFPLRTFAAFALNALDAGHRPAGFFAAHSTEHSTLITEH